MVVDMTPPALSGAWDTRPIRFFSNNQTCGTIGQELSREALVVNDAARAALFVLVSSDLSSCWLA